MKCLLGSILFLAVILPAGAADRFPPLERQSVLETPVPPANPPIKLVRGAHIRFAVAPMPRRRAVFDEAETLNGQRGSALQNA